jgi:glycosyltransferase involved in cell wall biosynthesis
MPCISVIIPTYNRAQTIIPALQSVLAQTRTDFEIIVADDGSSDNSREVLAPFAERVIYDYAENRGQSAARNRGARLARGEFLAFLDSDDLWEPRKLELQIPLLEQQPTIGWVYCDMDYFGNTPADYRPRTFSKIPPQRGLIFKSLLIAGCPMHTPTLVVRKTLFGSIGGYNESMRVFEDHDLYYRLAATSPADYVDQVLVHCRREDRGPPKPMTAKVSQLRLASKRRVLQEYPDQLRDFTELELQQSLGAALQETAVIEAMEGNYAEARKLNAECIRTCPKWWKPFFYKYGLMWPELFLKIRLLLAKIKHG